MSPETLDTWFAVATLLGVPTLFALKEALRPRQLLAEIVRLEPLAPNFGDCVSCDGYILDAAEFPHCPTCARLTREGKPL